MLIEVTGLAEAQAGFDPVDAGPYTLIVACVPEKKLNKEGTGEYLKWTFDIQGMENRKIWTNTSLQTHALFGLKGLIAALEKNNGAEIETPSGFDATACVGLKVGANLTIDKEYNSNKISSYFIAD